MASEAAHGWLYGLRKQSAARNVSGSVSSCTGSAAVQNIVGESSCFSAEPSRRWLGPFHFLQSFRLRLCGKTVHGAAGRWKGTEEVVGRRFCKWKAFSRQPPQSPSPREQLPLWTHDCHNKKQKWAKPIKAWPGRHRLVFSTCRKRRAPWGARRIGNALNATVLRYLHSNESPLFHCTKRTSRVPPQGSPLSWEA